MAETLTFYTHPMSRGRIVRWMLEETGAAYETEIVAYGPRSADFLAVNPMGKVPAIRHGGVVVTEAAAICAYLADAFPEAGLAPPPSERGAYYRWLFFAAGPVEAAAVNRALGVTVPEDKRMMVGYGSIEAVVDTLEGVVSAANACGGYLAGERFGAADVYVGASLGWMLQFDIFPRRPAFAAYWNRIKDRPAAVRARTIDDGIIAAMKEKAAGGTGA